MSTGWSIWISVIVLLNIAGCGWLLAANRKAKIDQGEEGKPLSHDFDGLQELNNPLPAWWSWLFVLTILYALAYLVAYPGLGSFPGLLGWSSTGQWQAEVDVANAEYGPIFAGYFATPIPELVSDTRANDMGGRLFANNCATCHGSDARGGKGYPNLTDGDWLYGGKPETIVQTITHGRVGAMPPLGAALGGETAIKQMAQYVLSLAGRDHDAEMAAVAAPQFKVFCAVCHGPEAKGNQAMGAPNLTDKIYLHRGLVEDIEYQIEFGRYNQMPAHKELLSEEKIHLLAAYVFSLSQ
jgi:cytochrome c oxidase cbb3-type subunit 3